MPETTAELTEKDILDFWKSKKIYEKSKKKNKNGRGFYMMDGPPYATGHIHMGTALNKISKDIVMRAKRLQGFDVFDRCGYDTHGVPIEFKIEKENNFKSKKDIEKFGVKKFINQCKEFATKYIDVMNEEFVNLGTWFDFKSPYLTLTNDYIETVWDVFKEADSKGLLFLDKYPVHVCPRCETVVAFNEIEYAKQDDTSIFVKFPLKDRKSSYLIIWTTTPWTLPGNAGVMVNPDFDYQEIELSSGEKWVMAKELIPKIMSVLETGYTIKEEFKGKEMENWEYYNPLFRNIKLNLKNSYRVVLFSRYVTIDEGTGLVHCAPGHGKEDYEVGKENGLDAPCPVNIDGSLTYEVGKYAGKKARIVDAEIIADLEKDKMLVYKQKYNHDYPLCWRCHTPLLMVSQPQWFLKISGIQKKLIEDNEKVDWIPKWAKLRMRAWLEGISDWPVSRSRYWGTPLPIWVCSKCDSSKVIGSIAELEKMAGKKIKEVHKPEIDKITFKCKCGGEMKRIEGVLDVWFDSGVSSWAALGYMKDKKNFEKFWPADLNLEGKDQIRGWWNSEMILSELKFNKVPFKAISMHGMILDLNKSKMSKSQGNIISPQDIIEKYSRDYMRYYFAKTSKGEDMAFKEEEFKEISKVFMVLLNVNKFVNGLDKKIKQKKQIEDDWILSKYNSALKEIVKNYDSYEIFNVVKIFEDFLVNDLSKSYIKLIRDRADECYNVLNEIRIGLLKVLAPICPFATEKIWRELKENKIVKEESIHLSVFQKINSKLIDENLDEKFVKAFELIEKGLFARDEAKVGLKWPLANAEIVCDSDLFKLSHVIKSQLNVKNLEFASGKDLKIKLDTDLTPELESEGFAREICRHVQSGRKKQGLEKKDKIDLFIVCEFEDMLLPQKDFISERVGAEKIVLGELLKSLDYVEEGKIKEQKFKLGFKKQNHRR